MSNTISGYILYDFTPKPGTGQLKVSEGNIVTIYLDSSNKYKEWYLVRNKENELGYIPRSFVKDNIDQNIFKSITDRDYRFGFYELIIKIFSNIDKMSLNDSHLYLEKLNVYINTNIEIKHVIELHNQIPLSFLFINKDTKALSSVIYLLLEKEYLSLSTQINYKLNPSEHRYLLQNLPFDLKVDTDFLKVYIENIIRYLRNTPSPQDYLFTTGLILSLLLMVRNEPKNSSQTMKNLVKEVFDLHIYYNLFSNPKYLELFYHLYNNSFTADPQILFLKYYSDYFVLFEDEYSPQNQIHYEIFIKLYSKTTLAPNSNISFITDPVFTYAHQFGTIDPNLVFFRCSLMMTTLKSPRGGGSPSHLQLYYAILKCTTEQVDALMEILPPPIHQQILRDVMNWLLGSTDRMILSINNWDKFSKYFNQSDSDTLLKRILSIPINSISDFVQLLQRFDTRNKFGWATFNALISNLKGYRNHIELSLLFPGCSKVFTNSTERWTSIAKSGSGPNDFPISFLDEYLAKNPQVASILLSPAHPEFKFLYEQLDQSVQALVISVINKYVQPI